jgi:hypothetical protein
LTPSGERGGASILENLAAEKGAFLVEVVVYGTVQGGEFLRTSQLTGARHCPLPSSEGLAEASIELSVGGVGDSYDNALAESVIGLFKAEVIYRLGPWKSFAAVEYKTLEWVDWFNHQRLQEPIGNIPPAEAAVNYQATLEPIKIAAWESSNRPSGKLRAVHTKA